jgi:DNA-binding XRE family transcriptional regulator
MPMGRPTTRERTDFGQRLFACRETAGLTQAEVAEQLGISQRAYSAWEREPVAILPERLAELAAILGTTVAELLGEAAPRRIGGAPGGRLGQSIEAISKLPRRQQGKILDVVEALLAQREAS